MGDRITVTLNGKPIGGERGRTLSELIKGEKPCGGHGKCGKCRVIALGALSEPDEAERRLLSEEELSSGIRLACRATALGDCEVRLDVSEGSAQIVTGGEMPSFELSPSFEGCGVAVDIGTTTVAARLYGVGGSLLAQASCLNPQQEWGADVISRIEAALHGKARELAVSVRQAVDGMITKLAEAADIGTNEIDGVVITGNTVMLSLLTEQSAEPFSHAPFAAERLFGETVTARELGISSLSDGTPIYLPPCISAFVGADTTCAILATELCGGDTAMLADIGTNGEMALWHNGKLTVCSTAAGPAFEGVGISMGMRGADGAIDKVKIENGQLETHVIGDISPVGICGSGLVDAASCMLELEIIDESGYLEDDAYEISGGISLTQKDIRMLQLAKSAICAGIATLAESASLAPSDIPVLSIAGGFGNYLNRESAARIGLLPKALAQRSRIVGNAALAGASMLLLNFQMRPEAETVAKSANVLDLSVSAVFSDHYMIGMMLEEK